MDFIHEVDKIYAKDTNGTLLALVDFPARDHSRIDITHVFVDESLRGQGIAGKLMELAYADIKNAGKRIVAKCPFAIAWFKKNPAYQDIVINVKTNPSV